jgi:GNAT superfamily N-acetyltransferase
MTALPEVLRLLVPQVVSVRSVSLTDPAVTPLLDSLDDEYRRSYGLTEELTAYDDREFEPPHGLMLVAELDGQTLSGGGFVRLDDTTAELKRMWTDPQHRGCGLARQLLAVLEQEAARRGYSRMRLQTGTAQRAAIRLYSSAGYRRIPNYGRYAAHVRALSFEKPLGG